MKYELTVTVERKGGKSFEPSCAQLGIRRYWRRLPSRKERERLYNRVAINRHVVDFTRGLYPGSIVMEFEPFGR